MKVDLGRGAPVWVAPRRGGGVALHQGASKIFLAPDELAAVLVAIRAVTHGSPPGREETTQSGVQ